MTFIAEFATEFATASVEYAARRWSWRQWLAVAVMLFTSTVAIVGGWYAWHLPTENATTFSRAGFHARVAEVDLDQIPESELRELTRLLERDVTQGRIWEAVPPSGPHAATRFHRNFDAILAAWVRQKAAVFAGVSARQREPYARRQAQAMRRALRAANSLDVRGLAELVGRQPPSAAAGELSPRYVGREMQRWEDSARGAARAEVRDFCRECERFILRRAVPPRSDDE